MKNLTKKINIQLSISISLLVLYIIMVATMFLSNGSAGVVIIIWVIVLATVGIWIWGIVNGVMIRNITGKSLFLLIASIILPGFIMLIAVILEKSSLKNLTDEDLLKIKEARAVNNEKISNDDDNEEVNVNSANKVYYKRLKGLRQATIAGRVANKTSRLLNEGCKIISVTQYAHAFSIGRKKAATIYYTKPVKK